MTYAYRLGRATLAPIALLGILAGVSLSASPAHAIIYCKTVGVPKGCVVRPVAAVAIATPGVGAPGVGVRRGTVGNRGGPVNRVGRR